MTIDESDCSMRMIFAQEIAPQVSVQNNHHDWTPYVLTPYKPKGSYSLSEKPFIKNFESWKLWNSNRCSRCAHQVTLIFV